MAETARIVAWTEQATADFEEILRYIERANPEAAHRLAVRTLAATNRLARFPMLGRAVPIRLRRKYREVVVAPCRIVYRTDERYIWIAHVRRFEQDEWPEDL